jgi:hypothetical protein
MKQVLQQALEALEKADAVYNSFSVHPLAIESNAAAITAIRSALSTAGEQQGEQHGDSSALAGAQDNLGSPAFVAAMAHLRELATGRVEWRVQDPVEKCYCMYFDRSSSINPERDAREWLADHARRFPDSAHAKYEVAEVRVFTELERAALAVAAIASEKEQSHG